MFFSLGLKFSSNWLNETLCDEPKLLMGESDLNVRFYFQQIIFSQFRILIYYIIFVGAGQYWLCESSNFPDFVDTFPDFSPFLLPYFPILCKLGNLSLLVTIFTWSVSGSVSLYCVRDL